MRGWEYTKSLCDLGVVLMKLESFSFNIFQSSEVTNLISCQPTALKAVRLQSLVPPNPDKIYIRDLLVKNEVRIHLVLLWRASLDTELGLLLSDCSEYCRNNSTNIQRYLYSRKPVCRICTVEHLFAEQAGARTPNRHTLIDRFIGYSSKGSSKYSTIRNNVQRYCTHQNI